MSVELVGCWLADTVVKHYCHGAVLLCHVLVIPLHINNVLMVRRIETTNYPILLHDLGELNRTTSGVGSILLL